MKTAGILIIASLFHCSASLYGQALKLNNYSAEAVNVSASSVNIMGKRALRAVKDSAIKKFDEPTYIRINGVEMRNGVVEVKVLSRLLPDAPEMARGFIGIAFRVNKKNNQYESIYVRPTNARSEDQIRRNHSIQYYSYPDYKFDRLRKDAPEKYESYADMQMNKWIQLRIEVDGDKAKLFIDQNPEPALIVNDLKHGANATGAIALWVEIGTEGYFADLQIKKRN